MARTKKSLTDDGPAKPLLVRLDDEARVELDRLATLHTLPRAEVVRRLIVGRPLNDAKAPRTDVSRQALNDWLKER